MERDLHNAFNGLRFHSPSSDKELASESSELWARLRHHSRLAFLGTLVHKTRGPGNYRRKEPWCALRLTSHIHSAPSPAVRTWGRDSCTCWWGQRPCSRSAIADKKQNSSKEEN